MKGILLHQVKLVVLRISLSLEFVLVLWGGFSVALHSEHHKRAILSQAIGDVRSKAILLHPHRNQCEFLF